MRSVLALLTLAGLTAAARRPTRCVGGGGRLTLCIDTNSGFSGGPAQLPMPPSQPRRYDHGGLYGPEYFRNRYGVARPPAAFMPAQVPPPPSPSPGYGYRYRYGYGYQPQPGRLPSPSAFGYVFQGRPSYGPPAQYGPPNSAPRYGRSDYGTQYGRPGFLPQPPAVLQPQQPYPVAQRPYQVAQRPYQVVPQPYPVVPRPYQVVPPAPQPGAFYVRPYVGGPQLTPHPDIRSFYNAASMLGHGRVSTDGRKNVEFVCDFSLGGVTPGADVLTDVVWQKVGRPVYMNNPMTSVSGYPNLLSCPNKYISATPTNYGFNIAGTKTTLVIKNATPADYGVYRCYATRVSRADPRRRMPVYMEVFYSPATPTTRRT